jgi:hypothetical protein
LTPSTSKRVILYRFGATPVEGHINPANSLREAQVEMITTDGMLQRVPYEEVKAICISAAGAKANLFLEGNVFERRPKLAGLWVRFWLRDGDRLEGILSHNLLEWTAQGFWLTPPHAGPGRQRVFLARQALQQTEVLGVIGAHRSGTTKDRVSTRSDEQLPMFPE